VKIWSWNDWEGFTQPLGATAVTIGVFDGLHLGHRKLIENIIQSPYLPIVVTFRENPKKLTRKAAHHRLISDEEKLKLFESLGVQGVVLIDFSPKFSKLTGREFLQEIENKSDLRQITIGFNFHCGRNRDTSAEDIRLMYRDKPIKIDIVEPQSKGIHQISSSLIRQSVAEGNLKLANELLGRAYTITIRPETAHKKGIQRIKRLYIPEQLPNSGVYPVTIYTKEQETVSEDLIVTKDEIRWTASLENVCRIVFET